MNVLTYKAERNLDEIGAAILRQIEHNIVRYDYLLPRGWRCIVEIESTTPEPDYPEKTQQLMYLDAQDEDGGGSWAQAKIKTMKDLADYQYATQPIEISRLIELVEGKTGNNYHDDGCAILRKAANVDALDDEVLHWLVDVDNGPGIAPGYGGITIPYEMQIILPCGGGCQHGEIRHECNKRKGFIRIAWSGGSQDDDLMFTFMVLHEIMDAFNASFKNAQCWFGLKMLNEIPATRKWIELFGLAEA